MPNNSYMSGGGDDPPEEGVPSLAETASLEGTVPIGVPVSQEEFQKLKGEARSGISAEGHTAVQEEEDPPEDLLFKVKEKPNA